MKDNKNCILLKRKEYDELIKKTETNKPDWIKISYGIDFQRNSPLQHYYSSIDSNFNISTNLGNQILKIGSLMSEQLTKDIDVKCRKAEYEIKESLIKELKSKNILQLIKWIKSK